MGNQLPLAPRKLITFTLAVTMASVLPGCGSSGSADSGGGKGGLEKKTLTVAALPLVDAAGLHIADERKLFEAEGLDVRVQPVQQSIQALPALAKGQVDVIAGANYVTFLQAQEKGTLRPSVLADAATLAPHMMDVLAMPDSGIDSAEDLKGKKVSVNILNNVQSLTLDAVLKSKGVSHAGVRYRQVPFPQMGPALEKKQIDAAHVAEPFRTDLLRKLRAKVVVDGGSGPVEHLPISGYVATRSFTDRYPRTAAAFQRAIRKAQAIAAKDRESVEKVLPGYARIDARTASAIALPGYPTSFDEKRMRRLTGLMTGDGLLKKEPDLGRLFFTPPR